MPALTAAVALLALAAALLAPPAAAQPEGAPALVADPSCFGLDGDPLLAEVRALRAVDCGRLEVPLDHDDPASGRASLAVAVLRAVGEPTGPPILKLTGGPGEAAIGTGLAAFGLLAETTLGPEGLTRDVILLDQRGTGYSQPNLDCPEVAVSPPAPTGASSSSPGWALADAVGRYGQAQGQDALLEQVAACRDRLVAAGVDLNAFGTTASARDLELLRQALGEDQVVLYGTSYGTKLALRAAQLFPTSWAALVLSSPVPGDANFLGEIATTYDEALAAVERACTEDPRCPYPPGLVQRASERVLALAEEPAVATTAVPGSEEPLSVVLDPVTVANLMYQLHYIDAAPVPPLLNGLADGNDRGWAFALGTSADGFAPPSPQLQGPGRGAQGVPAPAAFGMQLSNMCAEEVAGLDPDDQARRLAEASPLAAAFGAAPFFGVFSPEVCAVWGVAPGDPAAPGPVAADVPALVVTGSFDAITPASFGERTAEALPRSVLVEVPGAVHAPLLGLLECGGALLSDFLADPDGPLDTSCATDRQPALDTWLPDAPALGAERVAGDDRFATAVAASRFGFPQGSPLVVVASGEDFPDALVGGALAATAQAPLLLTGGDRLPDAVGAELRRLQPEQVVLLGGPAAVDSATQEAIGGAALAPVERLAGEDRAGTAAAVAVAMVELATAAGAAPPEAVWLVTGQDFPDALAAGAAAASAGLVAPDAAPGAGDGGGEGDDPGAGGDPAVPAPQPVLLAGTELPAATAEALAAIGPAEVVVVGGASAVPDEVAAAAAAAAGGAAVTRIAGPERYSTAALLAAATAPTAAPTSRLAAVAVTGEVAADALAATPLAVGRAPLVLVPPTGVPQVVADVLAGRPGSVVAIGGAAALPDAVLVDLAALLAPPVGGPPAG